MRKKTKALYVGDVKIGDNAPIAIQSMCNTKTDDIDSTMHQINALHSVGCDIVRLAVPDESSAEALSTIVKRSPLPIVADIHFDYRLALESIKNGVSALRINPGNIGSEDRILAVINEAKKVGIPIRIGINSGSLEKDLLEKYGNTPRAMVESAMGQIRIFEKYDFTNIKLSLKSSSVTKTVDAYRMISKEIPYPLHIGVTEAGTLLKGSIKSAIGIGILLSEGIGDTIRVSLTGDPVDEVIVAKEILKDLDLIHEGIDIISCPTCGRTKVDLVAMVKGVEDALLSYKPKRPLTVAVMGCEVNGPGEAKEADYGIASGRGQGLLFKDGVIIGKYKEEELILNLVNLIRRFEG